MSSQDKRWIRVTLDADELDALTLVAKSSKRNTRQQAAAYVIAGLKKDGLLPPQAKCPHCGKDIPLSDDVIMQALGADIPSGKGEG